MFSNVAYNPLLEKYKRHKKLLLFSAAPLLVLLLLSFVYIVQGIWPFGSSNIAYADMAQAYIPRYYHLYDAMNGNKSILFDWYTGTGVNMAGSLSTFLSPLNLIFYFFPRAYLLESMSVFLMLRMALMSFTAFYFLHKIFPSLDPYFKVTFGVMYAFSGYVLQYYTNIMWLDTAALFPLLILALLILLQKHKLLPFICTLTFGLIISFYLSFMSILFILFASALYILLILPKEKRKKSIFYLGTGTFTSLLLAAAVILPEYLLMSSSARTSNSKDYFDIINITLDFTKTPQINKFLMLLGTELLIVLLVKLIFKIKEDRNAVLFFTALAGIMAAPIFFEGINLLWHTGSYADFPLRFGYIIFFVLIWAAGYFLSSRQDKSNACTAQGVQLPEPVKKVEAPLLNNSPKKNKTKEQIQKPENKLKLFLKKHFTRANVLAFVKIFACAALIGASVPLLKKISEIFDKYGFYSLTRDNNALYKYVMMAAILYLVVFVLAMSLTTKRIRNTIVSVAVILPLTFYSIGLIGVENKQSVEHDDQYIAKTQAIRAALSDEEHSVLERVKNADVQLNTNYPMILERSALSNWTHLIPKELQTSLSCMGYSTVFTRTLDSGGTVFTDALLGITNTLTLEEANSTLYDLNKKAGEYYYYDNRFTLPFGITASAAILNDVSTDICYTNNMLYQSITGTNKEIMHKLQRTSDPFVSKIVTTSQAGNNSFSYEINVADKEVLYFWSSATALNIYVNNTPVKIPTYANANNLRYKSIFNNRLIELGTFEDETVTVVVTGENQISSESVNFAVVSLDKMEALTKQFSGYTANPAAGDTSISMHIENGSSDQYAFIPVGYDKGWNCTVNGESVPVKKAATGFMAVPLQAGVNDIEMHFVPSGLVAGSIISGITLLCTAGLFLLCKKRKRPFVIPNPALSIGKYIFFAVVVIAALIVYIVPLFYSIYQTFYTI